MAPKRKKPPQASLNRQERDGPLSKPTRDADTPGISIWLYLVLGDWTLLNEADSPILTSCFLLGGPSRETAAIASGADLSKVTSTAAAKKWAGILPKSGHGKRRGMKIELEHVSLM